MLSETVNALFLTYLGTEYLVISNQLDHRQRGGNVVPQLLLKPRNLVGGLVVLLWNVFERLSGANAVFQNAFGKFLHTPKIVLAAIGYVVALYFDCQRISSGQQALSIQKYLQKVGLALCYVLPVYPFLAVLISCAFFMLLTLLDLLKIDAEILNWPIYYGTLYGPFSFVYWKVKRSVVEDSSSLPSSQGTRLRSA